MNLASFSSRFEALKERNKGKPSTKWEDFSDYTWEEFKEFKLVKEKPYKTYMNKAGFGYYINEEGKKKYGYASSAGGVSLIVPYTIAAPSALTAADKGSANPPKGLKFKEEPAPKKEEVKEEPKKKFQFRKPDQDFGGFLGGVEFGRGKRPDVSKQLSEYDYLPAHYRAVFESMRDVSEL